ncbi:hypothetical protein ACHAWX_002440 [Stephanocyclus meneghinianus]
MSTCSQLTTRRLGHGKRDMKHGRVCLQTSSQHPHSHISCCCLLSSVRVGLPHCYIMPESRPPAIDDLITAECREPVSPASRYHLVLRQLNETPEFTDEWFRLKEEEIQLHSQLVSEHDRNNLAEEAESSDDNISGERVNNESTKSGSDQHVIDKTTNLRSRSVVESPPDTGNTQQTEETRGDQTERSNFNELASGLADAARSVSTPNKDDSLNSNDIMAKTRHLKSAPVYVCRSRDFKDEFDSEARAGYEGATGEFGRMDGRPPPIPLCLQSHQFEGEPKAKKNACIEAEGIASEKGSKVLFSLNGRDFENRPKPTVERADNVSPPVPFCLSFADDLTTNKLSRIEPAKGATFEKSSTIIVQPEPTPPRIGSRARDYLNHDQALPGQNSVQHFSAKRAAIGINQRPHTSDTIIQGTSNSSPLEFVRDDEEKEDIILIPQAFLVEDTASPDMAVAGVAELVESDQRWVTLRKRHACLLAIFIVAIVVALAIGLVFKNDRGSPIVQTSSQKSLSIRNQIEKNVLERNATFENNDKNLLSALYWITDIDQLQLDAADSTLYQRFVLALLSYEFRSDASSDGIVGWLSEKNECDWLGVQCNRNRYVNKLDLDSAGLKGTIPPEIGRLLYLENFTVRNNFLSGTLPPELEKLTLLTHLDIGNNLFTSTIPPELGNLKELAHIDLNVNNFSGSLPSEIGSLASLTYLNVQWNKLSNTLPSELGYLTKLKHLGIAANSFTGTLLSEIGALKQLTHLDAGYNHFLTGTLPSELGELTNLTVLKVHVNQFTGNLPTELGGLKELTYFEIYLNNFTGTLPSWIGDLKELIVLRINNNHFTGSFPSEVDTNLNLTGFCGKINYFDSIVPPDIEIEYPCTYFYR